MANRKNNFKVFLSDLKNDEISQKALFESMSSWLQGNEQLNIDFVGTKEKIDIVKNVMLETKKFQDSLLCKDASLEIIFNNLHCKHLAASSFKEAFNVSWIL